MSRHRGIADGGRGIKREKLERVEGRWRQVRKEVRRLYQRGK